MKQANISANQEILAMSQMEGERFDINRFQELIDNGADIETADIHGNSALMHLLTISHIDITPILEKVRDKLINSIEDSIFIGIASAYKNSKALTYLYSLSGRAEGSGNKNFPHKFNELNQQLWETVAPLEQVHYSKIIKRAQALIDKGAEVNYRNNVGSSTLAMTARRDMFEVFEFLVEQGASLEHFGAQALMNGAVYGAYNVVDYLLDRRDKYKLSDADKKKTIFHAIDSGGELDVLARLFSVFGLRDDMGCAIMYASRDRSLDVFKFLLERGVKIPYMKKFFNVASINNAVKVMEYAIQHFGYDDTISYPREVLGKVMEAKSKWEKEQLNQAINMKIETKNEPILKI